MTTQALSPDQSQGIAPEPPDIVPWLGPRRCGRPIATDPEPFAGAVAIRIVSAAEAAAALVAGALRPAGRESEA
jgi:hypothetical protein